MAALNRVILVGRIVRTPDLKKTTTSDLSVTSFTLAVDNLAKKNSEKTTSFIPCTCWNYVADNVAKYCVKGSLVAVEGRLLQRTYDDKTGQKRSVIEVVADNVQFLDKKNSTMQDADNTGHLDNINQASHVGILDSDEDIPF